MEITSFLDRQFGYKTVQRQNVAGNFGILYYLFTVKTSSR
jgi:hypothetical protein